VCETPLKDGFESNGEIRLVGTNIGGQLAMRGAKLTNPDGNTLAADGATITGDIFLDNGLESNGEIRLLGTNIGGQLTMSGAKLTNPDGNTLAADGATITGDIFLDNGLESNGQIRLLGTNIGGQLTMSGAKLTNPDGKTLNAGRATITGGVSFVDYSEGVARVLDPKDQRASTTDSGGAVHGRHFTTNGSLSFNQAKLLGLCLLTESPVRVLAVGANLGMLQDAPISWSPDSDLSGATYQIDPTSASWLNVGNRIRWLGSMTEFSRSSWQQLERAYRDHGNREAANDVAIAMRVKERDLRKGRWAGSRNLLSKVAEKLTGFGYRPERSLFALLALLALVFVPLAIPFFRESMTASTAFGPTYAAGGPKTKTLELKTVDINDRCGEGTVRCFNAALYAIDLVVPLVDLGQVDTWHPDAHRGAQSANWRGNEHFQVGAIMSWYLPIISLLGWALSTIGLLTITRLGNRPS
jgi:hypothetical protein